jgi:hypothetical protein
MSQGVRTRADGSLSRVDIATIYPRLDENKKG